MCGTGSTDCTITNATCDDSNTCSCQSGYVSEDSLSCIAGNFLAYAQIQLLNVIIFVTAATSLGDTCESDVKCTELLPNTQCLDNVCSCQSGYVERSGNCYEQKGMICIC